VRITERWEGRDEVSQLVEMDHGRGFQTVMTIGYRRSGS
jgi:hypothetical protein